MVRSIWILFMTILLVTIVCSRTWIYLSDKLHEEFYAMKRVMHLSNFLDVLSRPVLSCLLDVSYGT